MEGYLGPDLVSNVEYVGKEPNRATLNFKQMATRNAERIELFSNARETETKPDGTFYAAECLRQVCGCPSSLRVHPLCVCYSAA